MLFVLKMNHVKGDNETLQIFLVSASFGIKSLFLSGEIDEELISKTKEQGLNIKYIEEPIEWINEQTKGKEIINFHVQGVKFHSILHRIKESRKDKIIILGDKKMPGEIFALSDYNIVINPNLNLNVASLSIFLHELSK